MDDLNLDELDKEINNKNVVEERIRNLNSSKKLAEEKADTEAKARADAELRATSAEKERDFFASFSDSVSKFPGASEYKDKIKEKVMSGYSVDDATVSILHAEGKLGGQASSAPTVKNESPAGGSASNQITGTTNKSVGEMSQEERRSALIEAEKRGDISV